MGAFVRRQYKALQQIAEPSWCLEYFEMPVKARESSNAIIRYFLFFYAFIKQFVFARKKINLLHVHFYFPTILLAVIYKAFRNNRVKIVVTFHGSDIYHYQHFPWHYRYCYKFVDHAIFVSDELRNKFFDSQTSASILSAGILLDFTYEKSEKKYDLIFVGNLDLNKGALRLKNVIEKLPEKLRIAVVGTGEYSAQIKKEISHKGAYFPYLEAKDLAQAYRSSKWLINLSYNESFGLVISEAMACGTPVIATKTDGSLAQVSNNQNGVVIPQSENVFEDIMKILEQTSLDDYISMSNEAIQSSDKYKIDKVAREIKTIYLKLLPKV